jgi:hypothetical protein
VPRVEDEDLEAERGAGDAEICEGDEACHPHGGGRLCIRVLCVGRLMLEAVKPR